MYNGRKIKSSVFLLTSLLILAIIFRYMEYAGIASKLRHANLFNAPASPPNSKGTVHHCQAFNETNVTGSATKYPLSIGDNVYVIQNKAVCPTNRSVMFLMIVHSATDHSKHRLAIRRTWANQATLQPFDGRIVFLLGAPTTKRQQTLIEHESDKYGDIVQGNFADSYRNLTNKAVLGIRWITESCRQAKYVLKLDDDVFVNTVRIFEYLVNITNQSKLSRAIMCYMIRKGTALIQRTVGKWKLDTNEFKNNTYWPVTFCRGFFVIMTGELVPDLYDAAKTTPFMWIDDIYVYGLLANKTGNVFHYDLKNLRQYVRFVHSSYHMYTLWKNVTLSDLHKSVNGNYSIH